MLMSFARRGKSDRIAGIDANAPTDHDYPAHDHQTALSLFAFRPRCFSDCQVGLASAGEVAVDPADNGADVRDDTTEDTDSRSSRSCRRCGRTGRRRAPGQSDARWRPARRCRGRRPREPPKRLVPARHRNRSLAHPCRLSWSATELFEGVPVSTPVLVVNGRTAGPRPLCLTAAVHGDELNGVEMVRRVIARRKPTKIALRGHHR